jgi:hypothetical protein
MKRLFNLASFFEDVRYRTKASLENQDQSHFVINSKFKIGGDLHWKYNH